MNRSRPRPHQSSTPVVRMSSTADLVAAIPYLVGFVPSESLVVVSLRGHRLRTGLVARVDLPPPGEQTAKLLAAEMATYVGRDRAEQVLVVVYSDEAWDEAKHPRDELIKALDESFASASIGLREAAFVGRDRFWSYTCTRADCCPPQGTALDDTRSTEVAAQFVTLGRAPLPDRSALVERVRARGPLTSAAVGAAAERSRTDHVPSGCGVTAPGWRRDAIALFGALVDRRRSAGEGATVDEAGRLLAAMADIEVRDEVAMRWCAWFAGAPTRGGHRASAPGRAARSSDGAGPLARALDDPVTVVLEELATMSDGSWAVPALTLLALQFWTAGEGAVANAAVERALSLDPAYRMALLVDQVLRAGIPPRERHSQASLMN